MLIKKSQAVAIVNSDACAVWEYVCPSEQMSIATALITGRYPTEWFAMNTECEEIYYVLSWSGMVYLWSGESSILEQGDVYWFPKATRFWVEGKDLSLVLVNAPKWLPDQHEIVEKNAI